jgi:release factor glutamine methyltransferase
MTTVGVALTAAAARFASAGPDIAGSARLDAELLLGFVLGVERTRLLAYPEALVGDGQAERFDALVTRRAAGEPVAYLRGIQEFHGLAFAVDRRVLVPRPETELLVDRALEEIAGRLASAARPHGTPPLAIADVGTGSGAIAVALAVALRRRGMLGEVAIIASDACVDACDAARENVVGHAVADRVGVAEANLLAPPGSPAGSLVVPDRFDVVCANLPYVASAELDGLPRPVRFEPREALDGGTDGLTIIRRLLAIIPERAADGAAAFLEIGSSQGDALCEEVAAALPGWTCDIGRDLAGQPRLGVLRAPGRR